MKRFLAILFCLFLVLPFAACKKNGDNGASDGDASPIGAPDYSDSAYSLMQYAFIGPTDGTFTTTGGTSVVIEDHRTAERYREYKECGFDVLLLLGNDAYVGAARFGEPDAEAEQAAFATSQLKKNLDLCEEVGLKTIVFDDRLHQLSTIENTSLIAAAGEEPEPLVVQTSTAYYVAPFEDGEVDPEGRTFTRGGTTQTITGIRYQWESMNALVETLRGWSAPYVSHAAFYGVSMFDEPSNEKLLALGEVDEAMTVIDPDIFVQTVLLPYYGSGSSTVMSVADPAAFRSYVEEYVDKSGSEYFGYDYYGFVYSGSTEETSIQSTYLRCLQISAEIANAKNLDWEITVQTYAERLILRPTYYPDLNMQANLPLGFGADNINYFTYWMWQGKSGWQGEPWAIMDDYGNKLCYDEVQKVNLAAKKLAKIIRNFRYVKTALKYSDLSAPRWSYGLETSDLDGVTFDTNGAVILNELHDDAKDVNGYFLANIADPASRNICSATVTFDGFDCVMIVRDGETSYKKLAGGSVTLYLEEGESAFLIPYNNR